MESDDDTLYCLCRQPYDGGRFMIECDICSDWFHGSCVDVLEIQAADIEKFHCPKCSVTHGPLTLKKRRNWHRHDYSELDDGIGKLPTTKIQSGTVVFVQNLKNRIFPSTDEIPVLRLQGHQVRKEFFDKHGFTVPIIVDRLEGLGLKVPPPNFTILDVEQYVGSMREIDVIDVARQEDYKMLMREWTEYYNSPNRTKIFNVISLEFSKTRLAEIVSPPELVREISWASTIWPENLPEDASFEKPKVQRYCLMGVKDSFTDFHVDFGGTSVWYHVLRGEKVFYLVAPTPKNMELYENWVDSANQSECFFGDKADRCYRQVVKQGHTIFIPSGWIHAVLTPIDSLVFGGNFIHNYSIDMQIKVYSIERNVKTPDKYLFPNFETAHWYAAKYFHDYLDDCNEKNLDIIPRYFEGAKSIAAGLKAWTHKKDYIKREAIPNSIQYGKLLKDLNKVVKAVTQKMTAKVKAEEKEGKEKEKEKQKEEKEKEKEKQKVEKEKEKGKQKEEKEKQKGKKKKKKEALSPKALQELEELQALHSQTQQVMEQIKAESASKMAAAAAGGQKIKKEKGGKARKEKVPKDKAAKSGDGAPRLKMRIPKSLQSLDTSVYDFDDEEHPAAGGKGHKTPVAGMKTPPMRSPQAKLKGSKQESESPMSSPMSSPGLSPMSPPRSTGPMTAAELEARVAGLKASSSALKLKLLNGKVVSEAALKNQPGKFQLLGAPKQETVDSDDEGPGLVVDENPAKPKKKQKISPTKPGAVKGIVNKPAPKAVLKIPTPNMAMLPPPPPGLSVGAAAELSLKLKLSMNKTEQAFGIASSAAPEEVFTNIKELPSGQTFQSLAATLQDLQGILPDDIDLSDPLVDRMNMPTIRGGLNGSIADILEASGYGTETDFKIDDDLERRRAASPTMRDAIQGMLSMSRMTGPSPLTMGGASPFIDNKPKTTIRLQREQREVRGQKRKYTYNDDTGEGMPTCFKDEEYVYPTLDLSDNEDDHVFKPRGRQKKDETWNPKAKLEPNSPKPERPQREGTRRESVESGLAAAAARLATQPPPKRQYIRKKPKLSKSDSGGSPPEMLSPQPGTSYDLPLSPTLPSPMPFPMPVPTSPTPKAGTSKQLIPATVSAGSSSKKPIKKGMATAKQRLSKILGFKKMFR